MRPAASEAVVETGLRCAAARVASLSELLAEYLPAAPRELARAVFRPHYRADFVIEQVGIYIDILEEILNGAPLDVLPGVPIHAVRGRQLSYLAGRLCAEYALQRQGIEIPAPLGRGSAGQPLWPEGWTGSISHTADQAFAVVARRVGKFDLGIDAETVLDEWAQADVLQVCVHDSELDLVESQPDGKLATTIVFAAKEAYYKAVYSAVRRFVDFREVVLKSLDLATGCFELRPAAGTEGSSDLPPVAGRFVSRGGIVHACVAPGYDVGPQAIPRERT